MISWLNRLQPRQTVSPILVEQTPTQGVYMLLMIKLIDRCKWSTFRWHNIRIFHQFKTFNQRQFPLFQLESEAKENYMVNVIRSFSFVIGCDKNCLTQWQLHNFLCAVILIESYLNRGTYFVSSFPNSIFITFYLASPYKSTWHIPSLRL